MNEGRTSPERRARYELEQAERLLGGGRRERPIIVRAVVAAVVLHATVLVARMPDWGPDPVRVEAPQEQAMKVQFLKPPAPPKSPPKPPEPVRKKVPRPDPTPDEPEPLKEVPPPAPEAAPEMIAPPARQTGPIRVAPGQGPGLIRRVEPQYPPIARASRLAGTVVLDAVIQADGTVGEVKVLRSSNSVFDQACIDAIRQWRYTPGPHDVILTVTVNFTLQ